jgi:hypothetical protein
MKNAIRGVDHPVIAVRDMEGAHADYKRLGFTMPPRGSHIEWGTGNWCIMFADDYLELRGIIDSNKECHGLDRFLERRQGLMGVALATNDVEKCHALLEESGLHPGSVRQLKRNFELEEGTVQPQFSLCFLDEAEAPGLMSVVMLQHMTPELIRRPDWLHHANGARGVASMTAVVEDLEAAAVAHARLFGAEAIRRDGPCLVIEAQGNSSIRVVEPSEFEKLSPGLSVDKTVEVPGLVSVTLTVDDVDATARHFAARQIDFEPTGDTGIRVAPEEACGVNLIFEECA